MEYRNPNDYWQKRQKEKDYEEFLHLSRRFLWAIVAICLMAFVGLALCGCRAKKPLVSETSDTKDSVRVEYKEKIVKVPVTVYVEVPIESHINMTNDSSHLETGFAVSDAAMIWIDSVPFLRHTLANKAQAIGKKDSVEVVEKEKVVWKTRRVTYTKTEYVQKDLSWWQKVKILFGGWSLLLNAIAIVLAIWKRKSIFALN
jgi:hypothetical protein